MNEWFEEKNYKTTNHLRSIELMFSFATILLRKSSNLAQALTTMMSTKNSNVNRPNLKSELGLEDLLSWWRSPLLDCLDGIVGHLVPFIDYLVIVIFMA